MPLISVRDMKMIDERETQKKKKEKKTRKEQTGDPSYTERVRAK